MSSCQLTFNSWTLKLTIFNSDIKLLVLEQMTVHSTSVVPRVRLGQVGDAHIHNCRRYYSCFFTSDAVSASVSFVTSCFNKNVFFSTFFLTEDLPAFRDEDGALVCDGASLLSCKLWDFYIDESSDFFLQSC